MPMLSMLTRPQRMSYILSSVLMGCGWLFLLALTLGWSASYWSRPVLALQGAALVVALLLVPYTPAQRLIRYTLTLAVSIYLWIQPCPHQIFQVAGRARSFQWLVLAGVLVDSLRAVQWGRGQQRRASQEANYHIALDDAARVLCLAVPELRIRLQQRRLGIRIDTAGREYLSIDQLVQAALGEETSVVAALWLVAPEWRSAPCHAARHPHSLGKSRAGHVVCARAERMAVWMWKHRNAVRDADRAMQQRIQTR